jgi:hypothetical protein
LKEVASEARIPPQSLSTCEREDIFPRPVCAHKKLGGKRTMNPLNAVRRGLIGAMPVCLVVVAIIMVRADAIEASAADVPTGLGGQTAMGWVGTWVIVTLAFGVVSASVYDYLSEGWGWNGNEYLSFAAALAVSLSAIAFLKMYNGEMHPFRFEYTALNFAYAFGFGVAIPLLSRADAREKVIKTRAGQTPQ